VRVHLDVILPLADAAAAHLRSETGRARGKIVLRVE
jgi:NADPH:quinone reductase-like Zn-dependent oxidoreductase